VFSPDGTRVVTASSDKTARAWDVSILNRRLREVAAQICRSPVLFPRDFSGADLLADPVLAHIRSARSAVDRVCAELHADVPISISPGNPDRLGSFVMVEPGNKMISTMLRARRRLTRPQGQMRRVTADRILSSC
jgi:hypothetical protein